MSATTPRDPAPVEGLRRAVVVDARGDRCPVPVTRLARALESATDGDEVILLSDDPTTRVDVPVWCRMKTHRLDGVRELAGYWSYAVRRGG